MTGSRVCRFVFGLALVPALVAAQGGRVQVSLTDTGVTLIAENATSREILAEWKRVTGVTVVGLERLGGEPLTLLLENVPEREALDAVLRATAGRMYVDRDQPAAGQSQFDRIVILPTRSKPAATTASTAAAQIPPHAHDQPHVEPLLNEVAEQQIAAAEAEAREAFAAATWGSAQADDQTDASSASRTPVPAPMSPVVGPDEEVTPATSTDFDYANPQSYFQMRARLRMQREGIAIPSQTGSVYVPSGQSSGGVTVVGGNTGSSRSSSQQAGQDGQSGSSNQPDTSMQRVAIRKTR